MPSDRAIIVATLERQRAHLEAAFDSFSDEELTAPCTASEDPDGGDWSPKDHLAHLLRIEKAFLGMAEATIGGDEQPIKIAGNNLEERIAQVHRDNEEHVVDLRSAAVADLFAALSEARADTLSFIDRLTEEQLATPIPGAPWGDGTIGGVLMANAGHEHQHLTWINEGLAR